MKKEDLKKYLEEQLSGSEKQDLDKKISDDPFLSESLEGLQQWKTDTHRSLDSLEKELHEQVDTRISPAGLTGKMMGMPFVRLLLVAACLTGICFFSLHYFLQQRNESVQLFTAYFKPLSHPEMTVRGEDATTGNIISSQAVKSYESENYKQAIYYYKILSEKEPGNEQLALFLGISYLANHQPEQAIAVLNKSFPENIQYENDRYWYLALSYIRVNNLAAAKAILQQLSKVDSYYKEQSITLLKALP